MANQLFNETLEITQHIWREQFKVESMRNIRMPVLETQKIVTTVNFDALWTDSGLRPNANNLAFLIQNISDVRESKKQWEQRLQSFPVRASLLVSSDDLYLLEPHSDSLQPLASRSLNIEDWREMLESSKPYLFTPKALVKFRQGQLSLADLEETVSERSFSFILRQQQQIDEAFTKGIKSALETVKVESNDSFYPRIQGHIIRYSIAYLAARILQDKNFFGTGQSIHDNDQDPITLLNRMIRVANGFFGNSKKSESFLVEHTRESFDRVRQELVEHIGYKVSFALTDHRDVGSLYEKAIKQLPPPKELSGKEWGDLNRHYTPVRIAERMLEALPLERLRPEERYIFDPAAGSGSLLLAATSRLAAMTDIPMGIERQKYLKDHVAGNDKDEYAKLIAQLRYFLASESLGQANEQITNTLPFPDAERNFTCGDYEKLNRDNLPIRPKVIVANPPFSRDGNTEKAIEFVHKALSWMEDGSQFAFVLPQLFLTGTGQVKNARDLIGQQCQILETWQFPESVIGTNARQSTCVIIGIKGGFQNRLFTCSRAIISTSKLDETRNKGFLGKKWISVVNPDNNDWSSAKYPPIKTTPNTISLGNLFYVFRGVELNPMYKPIKDPLENVKCKQYWSLQWKGKDRLLASINNIPNDKRWIRYGSEYLKEAHSINEFLFDLPKILVRRRGSSNCTEPLVVRLDTIGFCPNTDVFCIIPIAHAGKHNNGFLVNEIPENWNNLTYEDQRLWLLGILASNLICELSMSKRDPRGISINAFLRLPLPAQVDTQIIEVTKQIVQRDQNGESIPDQDDLRHYLNELVENSYGNPKWTSIQRTGISPELKAWQNEQEKPTKMAIGQVLEISEDQSEVLMYISRLMDDDEAECEWIPLPQELPGWALDGTPFEVQLSKDIKTFEQLRERPWALRKFVHEPRAYLTNEELEEFLRIPELELPL